LTFAHFFFLQKAHHLEGQLSSIQRSGL